MVLLDFTGSDWCGWCIKLKKDTFSKPEFQKLAEEKLVLVELDFPRSKTQSAELKKQNQELAEKFGIEGFPTLVLLSSQGTEVARNVGYLAGGFGKLLIWAPGVRTRNTCTSRRPRSSRRVTSLSLPSAGTSVVKRR